MPAPGPTGHVPTGEGAGRAAPRGPPGPDHKTHTALRCHRSHPPQPCHTPARRRAGTRGPSSLVPEGLRPGGRSCLLPETGGSTASPSCKQEVITELGGLLVWGLQAHSDLLSSDQTPHPPGGGPRPLSITPLPRPPSPGGTCHCRRPPLPRPLVGHICRLRSLPAGWGAGREAQGLSRADTVSGPAPAAPGRGGAAHCAGTRRFAKWAGRVPLAHGAAGRPLTTPRASSADPALAVWGPQGCSAAPQPPRGLRTGVGGIVGETLALPGNSRAPPPPRGAALT